MAWRNALGGMGLAVLLALTGCTDRQAADPSAAVTEIYRSAPPGDRMALRLAHLKGYFLVAAQQPEPRESAALASQGMLEVYDAQPGAFGGAGLNEGVLRGAAAQGTRAEMDAALATLTDAQTRAGGDPAGVLGSMVRLANSLYGGVENGGGVDGLEYQHSFGAALAARDLGASAADPRLVKARADLDRLVALWPGPVAPDHPVPAAKIDAATSQIIADLN
jgi:hypothetical protein